MAEVNAVEKQPVTQEYLKKMDAYWREKTGRAGCIIAANSDEAVRLVCGIAVKIKG